MALSLKELNQFTPGDYVVHTDHGIGRDEEQKFGVSVKEKLRQMKVNVDTLTMTATPIPRTLQFSLMGARDLSVIQTPPPNRYPIQTEVHTFNEDIITEAINFEMSRNGQVFFVNNRIQNLVELESMIKRNIPDCRVCIGHGQMEPEKLEKIIFDFVNYDYDVLLATTIIESGIDIPNANTIIINQAQNFGLSDLHQMRGRVGRSNKKAFCYLLAPPLTSLTPEAKRRLQAIENFSDLGSGIHIAMQDLDIRGAGNMLGAEQSGFIADLGYETYQKILAEAVKELKEDEFADLYAEELQAAGEEKISGENFVDECQVESDLVNIDALLRLTMNFPLVCRDGAECAATETAPVNIDGEFNHIIRRNSLPFVFGMRQPGIRQIERMVEFFLAHRRIGRIDYYHLIPYCLCDS